MNQEEKEVLNKPTQLPKKCEDVLDATLIPDSPDEESNGDMEIKVLGDGHEIAKDVSDDYDFGTKT